MENATDGPFADALRAIPTGLADTLWIVALGGLGIALLLGIAMRLAGWGGFVLNLFLWAAVFPPEFNPIIDAEHTVIGLALLLLMYVRAGGYWGLGRRWEARMPAVLR